MKKIWDKSVFEYNKQTKRYELNERESTYHFISEHAPVMQMKGGGNRQTGGTTENTNQTQTPWQQKYQQAGLDAAQNDFLNNDQQFNFSPDTLAAQDMTRGRAQAGSPLTASTSNQVNDTLNGKYLGGGQGFDAALTAASHKINPMVDSNFERSGRGGSGLATAAKATATNDAFAGLYGDERNRQLAAAGLAPQTANMGYADADRMAGVGAANDARNQFNQNSRRDAIAKFMNLTQGNMGGTTTGNGTKTDFTTTPGGHGWRDYLANGGGGAAEGYATAGAPGAAAGGLIGLLRAYMQNH